MDVRGCANKAIDAADLIWDIKKEESINKVLETIDELKQKCNMSNEQIKLIKEDINEIKSLKDTNLESNLILAHYKTKTLDVNILRKGLGRISELGY